jgi:hypothetical protein
MKTEAEIRAKLAELEKETGEAAAIRSAADRGRGFAINEQHFTERDTIAERLAGLLRWVLGNG